MPKATSCALELLEELEIEITLIGAQKEKEKVFKKKRNSAFESFYHPKMETASWINHHLHVLKFIAA